MYPSARVLNLATVADMDLAQASDFVTDGLTALGMSASQATDFVDMFIKLNQMNVFPNLFVNFIFWNFF